MHVQLVHGKVWAAAVDCTSLLKQICRRELTAENHDVLPEDIEIHDIALVIYSCELSKL